jgi:preprotein translocase subunit SecA
MKRFASDRVAGLMERMGLEGDVAIESRLVSKTIENAQSRVEGYNFDIRKRVVEYDDVINKQRETIYAERDKVLYNEGLKDTILDFVEDEVRQHVEQHFAGPENEWDPDGLARAIGQLGIEGEGLTGDDFDAMKTREEAVEAVMEAAEKTLDARAQKYGAETWSTVERLILLRSIDQLWVEHLTELDDFRRGVGLRGYGGTDPLVEFKREAFKLYEELRGFIRHNVASTIFRVNVQVQQPAPPPQPQAMPMPTAEQLALIRARAATAANQRAAAAAANAAAAGTAATAPEPQSASSATTPAAAPVPSAREQDRIDDALAAGRDYERHGRHESRHDTQVADDVALAEAAYDAELPDEVDVTVTTTADGLEEAVATTAAPAVPVIQGLSTAPKKMVLQKGDETVDSISGVQSGAPKVGRNDPCFCGSGMKYKKCHGK